MMPAYDEAWFASRAVEGVRGLKAYDPGHDVAALRLRHGNHFRFGDRQPQSVRKLVDQDEIADFERGPHRRRWNLEGFRDKRAQQEA